MSFYCSAVAMKIEDVSQIKSNDYRNQTQDVQPQYKNLQLKEKTREE